MATIVNCEDTSATASSTVTAYLMHKGGDGFSGSGSRRNKFKRIAPSISTSSANSKRNRKPIITLLGQSSCDMIFSELQSMNFDVTIEDVRNKWTGDSEVTLHLLLDELTSTKKETGTKYAVAFARTSSPPMKRNYPIKRNAALCFKCCNGGSE